MIRKGERGFDPNRDKETEGYSSYDTWNVALYLEHDRMLNHNAEVFMELYYIPELGHPYIQFSAFYHYQLNGRKTPDGIPLSFRNPHLNLEELDKELMEYRKELEDGTADH